MGVHVKPRYAGGGDKGVLTSTSSRELIRYGQPPVKSAAAPWLRYAPCSHPSATLSQKVVLTTGERTISPSSPSCTPTQTMAWSETCAQANVAAAPRMASGTLQRASDCSRLPGSVVAAQQQQQPPGQRWWIERWVLRRIAPAKLAQRHTAADVSRLPGAAGTLTPSAQPLVLCQSEPQQ